jgi:glycerol-3-phosphate dehydrogenase (NAD(P)+)
VLATRHASCGLWARRAELAQAIEHEHRNPEYLPDHTLPDGLRASSELAEVLTGAEVVVMAVPSHGFRAILEQAVPHVTAGVPIVSLTKGLEQGTLSRMTEVVAEVLPGHPCGVLTGPNLAREVMAGDPTASVIAMGDGDLGRELQELFSTEAFRVYTNPDVAGCELAGALKNVMAIASGMADGMGFGDNTRAALITRGLAELSRLGIALGGDPLTFSGLAGMGDLVATCTSRQSRNRHVGEQLGRGRSLAEVTAEMRMVAEGVKTSPAVVELAARHDVETPIAQQVVEVLYHGRPAVEALPALMQREVKPELHGIRR